jgi:hypothetical protein
MSNVVVDDDDDDDDIIIIITKYEIQELSTTFRNNAHTCSIYLTEMQTRYWTSNENMD